MLPRSHAGSNRDSYNEDPKLADEGQIEAWMKQIRTHDLSDKLCENVICRMPLADQKIEEWTQHPEELYRRSGWILLYIKAGKGKDWKDADFSSWLERIEGEIHAASNWEKEAMNMALIAIGARSKTLHERALPMAKRIGTITIDYGDTFCKNPDAVESLTGARVLAKLA